jgi:hypothetical protein
VLRVDETAKYHRIRRALAFEAIRRGDPRRFEL